jgi:hypothetical protein
MNMTNSLPLAVLAASCDQRAADYQQMDETGQIWR